MGSFDNMKLLFEKKLSHSDANLFTLKIPRRAGLDSIWKPEELERGILLPVYAMDEERVIDEKFVVKSHGRFNQWMIQKGWRKFVQRRELKVNDVVQVWWDHANRGVLINCRKPVTPASDRAHPGMI